VPRSIVPQRTVNGRSALDAKGLLISCIADMMQCPGSLVLFAAGFDRKLLRTERLAGLPSLQPEHDALHGAGVRPVQGFYWDSPQRPGVEQPERQRRLK
jgi:hypothetical protein